MSVDVLVIGGGMAGAMAALRAREKGASVILARRALGATALSSGAIDVAADPVAAPGDFKALSGSYVESAREVARRQPAHPYAVLGAAQLERLDESLAFAAKALEGLVSPPSADGRNRLLPSPLGTTKPTALAQRSQWAADLMTLPARVAVVELALNPTWNGALVARGLSSEARAAGRHVELFVVRSRYFDRIEDAMLHPHELAARLELPGALAAFADELKRLLPPEMQLVLVPPILGWKSGELGEMLTKLVGIPCAELLSTCPSVPGLRLQTALDAAVQRRGVKLIEGEVRALGGAQTAKLSIGGEAELHPRSVVLATGKFIGGGIERHGSFREPLFDLPVFSDEDRLGSGSLGELLEGSVVAAHQAFRAGVRTDAELRPVGEDGRAVAPWLRAAGSVLAGYDPATDKTGLGVAIYTGFLAGELAAREL